MNGVPVDPVTGDVEVIGTGGTTEGQTISYLDTKVAVGDSLTRGYDAGGDWGLNEAWPAFLAADDPGANYTNLGRSGMTVDEIGIHIGALVLQCTVAGGSIPASGTVNITIPAGIGWRPSRTWTFEGVLGGVPGTLTRTTSATTALTFTRTTPGAAVHAASALPFVVAGTTLPTYATMILGIGRNDVGNNVQGLHSSVAEHVIEGTKRIVNFLAPQVKRFILWGCTTGTGELSGTPGHTTVTTINNALADLYPLNYVDMRDWLVSDAIYALGITPTSDDLAKIAGDTLPPSIMVDSIHMVKAVHPLLAARFQLAIKGRNWLAPAGFGTPPKVTGLTLTFGADQITAAWTPTPASPAVTDYEVEYKTTAGATWTTVAGISTTPSATITGLSGGTSYDVRVRAVNDFGEGPWSATASATPVGMLAGSSREWNAKVLAVGAIVAPWADLRGGAPLVNAGGSVQPTVMEESGVKFVRFDGVDDLVSDTTFSGAQPHTRVIRFRWHTLPSAGRTVIGSTGTGTAGNTLGIVSVANNYTINAGTALVAAPAIAPSTSWVTAIVVFNGTTSVLSVNGVETTGPAGANTGIGLRVGAGSGTTPTTFAAIDVQTVAVIPHAADSTERAAILAALAA